MGEEEKTFRLTVERVADYRFAVDFGQGTSGFVMDEPPPQGSNAGPNPSRLIAAAVGDCLSASLLFCLQRSRVEVGSVRAEVEGRLERNERGRWRIIGLAVELTPEVPPDKAPQLARCAEIFEDFCIASKSVEQGIPITLKLNA